MPNKSANRGPDVAIARVAARQHGVITRRQLVAAGLLPSGISDRVKAGRLYRIHRGVYAVGHSRLSNEGRWMAAVLACGDGAVLSHRSAAELWRMLRPRSRRNAGDPSPVDVTVPGTGGRRRRRGISVHRSSTLTAAVCRRCDGIPVTSPARTLADLRPVLSEAEFAAAIREAEFLRLPIGGAGDPGRSKSPPCTRTELEAMFVALVRRHRLLQPEVNVRVDRYEVDFLWRRHRLIVEVDGWESHRTRSAFEGDRARDARLKMLGFDVLRFTWRQVAGDSTAVAATIRTLLTSPEP